MKIRKLLAAALALVLVLAAIPVVALAEEISAVAVEAQAMRKLDNTWAALEAVEAEAIASGMNRTDVIKAVYQTALNLENVDADGFSDFTKDGFYFTVDGMYCAYNFRLRNELDTNCEPVTETKIVIAGSGSSVQHAGSPDVFLVGPYYGHDGSFTDQYKQEAQSIAAATGGTYTMLQSTGATGPAIAENFPNKGVVIYDSHGTQSGTSSYLCLTTNSGITQTDYSNGWAVNAGSAAYIDGRYIENHVTTTLSDTFVWMAICEGMKRQGQGTTGYALLRAGCGAVYGYSQSVTFAGDYKYEATFWTHMKDGETAAEAYNAMVAQWGIPDPHGDAYPIMMSPVDPFPSNPDAAQTVNCDWLLYGDPEPVELESFSLSTDSVEAYIGRTASVSFLRVPDNANQYELEWTSANPAIATVAGNNRGATITGTGLGTTTITCTVRNMAGTTIGAATVSAHIIEDTTLKEALNIEGGTLSFSTSENYPFVAEESGGRYYAKSGNVGVNSSTSTLTTVITMQAGETLTFDYCFASESNYDFYNFTVNGTQVQHLSGTSNTNWQTYTYTAPSAGTYTFTWEFVKDVSVASGMDCCKIDNVAYSGDSGETPVEPNGDVDGDGTVTVTDALLALRIAMGIVEPTEDQLAMGDLDGDGTISATEALTIMRMAMGI